MAAEIAPRHIKGLITNPANIPRGVRGGLPFTVKVIQVLKCERRTPQDDTFYYAIWALAEQIVGYFLTLNGGVVCGCFNDFYYKLSLDGSRAPPSSLAHTTYTRGGHAWASSVTYLIKTFAGALMDLYYRTKSPDGYMDKTFKLKLMHGRHGYLTAIISKDNIWEWEVPPMQSDSYISFDTGGQGLQSPYSITYNKALRFHPGFRDFRGQLHLSWFGGHPGPNFDFGNCLQFNDVRNLVSDHSRIARGINPKSPLKVELIRVTRVNGSIPLNQDIYDSLYYVGLHLGFLCHNGEGTNWITGRVNDVFYRCRVISSQSHDRLDYNHFIGSLHDTFRRLSPNRQANLAIALRISTSILNVALYIGCTRRIWDAAVSVDGRSHSIESEGSQVTFQSGEAACETSYGGDIKRSETNFVKNMATVVPIVRAGISLLPGGSTFNSSVNFATGIISYDP